MRIIGIDPGSHRIGFSILERDAKLRSKSRIVEYGTIEIPPGTKSPENLQILRDRLLQILQNHSPQIACVEDIFYAKNMKTAKTVTESRGVILLLLADQGLKILQPSATQIKKGVTGSGSANKKDISRALQIIFALDSIDGLDDSWDAIAAGFVGLSMC